MLQMPKSPNSQIIKKKKPEKAWKSLKKKITRSYLYSAVCLKTNKIKKYLIPTYPPEIDRKTQAPNYTYTPTYKPNPNLPYIPDMDTSTTAKKSLLYGAVRGPFFICWVWSMKHVRVWKSQNPFFGSNPEIMSESENVIIFKKTGKCQTLEIHPSLF